jgi:flagellar biosynthetic protein FliS
MKNDAMNYATTSAAGLSPLGLVIRLYETMIGDLGRAILAIRECNTERRTFELQHALAILGHLQGALDMGSGGEPAKMLDRFYDLARSRILQSQFCPNTKVLEDLILDLGSLREAWVEVEKSQTTSGGSAGLDDSRQWLA